MVDYGASIFVKNDKEQNCLHFAVIAKKTGIAHLLIRLHADLRLKFDRDKKKPVDYVDGRSMPTFMAILKCSRSATKDLWDKVLEEEREVYSCLMLGPTCADCNFIPEYNFEPEAKEVDSDEGSLGGAQLPPILLPPTTDIDPEYETETDIIDTDTDGKVVVLWGRESRGVKGFGDWFSASSEDSEGESCDEELPLLPPLPPRLSGP